MKDIEHRDTIYAQPQDAVGDFVFDERVVSVFSDMIKRSVPGYVEVLKMTGWLAAQYARSHTNIYDLGCSLGDTAIAIGNALSGLEVSVIAVDNAPAMTASCSRRMEESGLSETVSVRCEDIRETIVENASVAVLNYTLQFIPPDERLDLLRTIYAGMIPGGVLVVSEKIAFEDAGVHERMTVLHHAFKRANGYSELEISQKRAALEKVLIPDSLPAHLARLREAGFASSMLWFQCLNFASLLAVK